MPDPSRIFDRLYHGNSARNNGGAGLGLTIVRELMEQMGGKASARIEDGELLIELSFSGGMAAEQGGPAD